MEGLVAWFVLFAGCFAQEDMGKHVFLFPKSTSTDHVILKPDLDKPLTEISVCLRSYTELDREHSLFSLAMPGLGKDDTFIIFPRPPNTCTIYINQEQINFKVDIDILFWKHTCVTWDSDTRVVQLWINGKPYPRRVSNKGSSIGPEISVILGQEQDYFGGGFDTNQSFVGEICDVNFWDYVLPPQEIQQALTNLVIGGNIISWRNLTYVNKGNAIVLNKSNYAHISWRATVF